MGSLRLLAFRRSWTVSSQARARSRQTAASSSSCVGLLRAASAAHQSASEKGESRSCHEKARRMR